MKMFRFLPLIKASVVRNKIRSLVFVLFIMFCLTSILITVSIILPMWNNMENKVNNHPYNRVITAELSKGDKDTLNNLSQIDNVLQVERAVGFIGVMNKTNDIYNRLDISSFFNNYTPVITAGNMFNENDENVAVLPEVIHDINPLTQSRTDVNCKEFIGKTLEFTNDNGYTYSLKIVGVYDITDPALGDNTIYIPYKQMLDFSDEIPSEDDTVLYNVIIDNYRNRDAVLEKCSRICLAYFGTTLKIDLATFNMSLIVLLVVLVAFLIMVVVGMVIFVSSCVKSRTNELALYRSLGYKPYHIFTIIFLEYILLLSIGFVMAVVLSVLGAQFIVNPYLDVNIGQGIMAMQAEINLLNIVISFTVFIFAVALVCLNATKRTEEIQLAILLKER